MGRTILVADDEAPIRQLLRTVLEREGYNVVEARDGREALRALTTTTFDLVITDIVMPEVDGLEMIVRLRKQSPGTKVVAISGGENLFLADAAGLGAAGVIQKPFRAAELLATVRELLSTTRERADGSPAPVA